jgi:thiol-disulfide isomerase/thioredoxin
MGRLSVVNTAGIALSLLVAAGCDANKGDLPPPPPTTGRSNAVAAKTTDGAGAPDVSAHGAAKVVSGPPRQLCAGQSPRPAPRGAPRNVAAPGESALPAAVPFGVGKWTWVNLWAAWCAPCKEEMPRLREFQSKLSAAGVLIDLVFVSLDDDERQLQRFIDAQPKGSGVRASYWLPDGEARGAWLAAFGVKPPADLPLQALVAPSGQLSCVIQGAIDDRDYPVIAALLGARRP